MTAPEARFARLPPRGLLSRSGRPFPTEIYTGKVAVVTGAASGIGRELAVALATEGARLALSDVNAAGLAETLRLVEAAGAGDAKTYALNVADKDAVLAHAEAVLRDFGGVHYLFNNAGVTLVATIAHATIEELEWQIGINLWGVIYCTKAFLPAMLAQKEGCIVNLSSVFGLVAFPTQAGYNITKFGVRAMTEALWHELDGTGVRAVCVHPGGIKTNIEKSGRRGRFAGEDEAKFAQMGEKVLVTPPEDCARDILAGVRAGKRRILTGKSSSTLFWLSRLFPNRYYSIVKRTIL